MTLKFISFRLVPLANRPRRIDLPHLRAIDLADWTLRGISQVVFQNNRLTGLVILGAIAYNSGTYAVSCVLGTVVATLTAVLLQADREQIGAGLFGYNGALMGIGLNAYLSADFTAGQYPDWRLYLYIVLGVHRHTCRTSSMAGLWSGPSCSRSWPAGAEPRLRSSGTRHSDAGEGDELIGAFGTRSRLGLAGSC